MTTKEDLFNLYNRSDIKQFRQKINNDNGYEIKLLDVVPRNYIEKGGEYYEIMKQHPETFINKGLIVNYSQSGTRGTHWIAFLFRGILDYCLYFDSFGMRPSADNPFIHENSHFRSFLKLWNSGFKFNKYDLQSLDSHVCGLYALHSIVVGGMPDFASFFDDNFPSNSVINEWNKYKNTIGGKRRDKKIELFYNFITDPNLL